jgi:DNA-binding CsgD family transcriptional regulator
MIDARRLRLRAARGEWAEAEAGLRALLDDGVDPGLIGHETMPALARLLVRRGDEEAAAALAAAGEHATRADVLLWLVPTGLAHIEHAWLSGRPQLAGRYPELLLERTDRPGAERYRAELLRHLRRLGHPAEPFPGCPESVAAGLRGDWRAAAEAWQRLGRPYEGALELAESGEPGPTLEALAVLTKLGALPAAAIVRDRLREHGVRQRPRAPHPGTLANAAGLTVRQVEILRLVAQGLSNAEIAHRLVLSTRTVDHHVSAVLQKLGLASRRDAAAALATLEPLR